MKTLARISGIVGLILFVFGMISYVLTHVNSLFFYVHIFGGLGCILFYFIYLFRGSKEFLALMLIIIFTVVGTITLGTFSFTDKSYVDVISIGIIFIMFLLFNIKGLKNPKLLPYFLVPLVLAAIFYVFKLNNNYAESLSWAKYWVNLLLFGSLIAISQLVMRYQSIRDGVLGKSTKYAVNVLLYSGIFLLILIVLNILAYQYDWKKDLTENRINMLSEQSVKILKNLKDEVNVYAFFTEKNREKEILKEILKMYTSETKKLKVEFIDPDLKPQRAKQYNAKDGDIIIECRGEEKSVKQISEETITTALKQVTKTVKPLVCFTQGHGEMELEDTEQFGLAAVAEGIKNEGYETKTLKSLIEGVPFECDIFVVAGPTIPFTQKESQAIDAYLKSGGKGLFMLDPRIPDVRLGGKLYVLDTGLENLAKKYGAKLGKNFILERHLQLFAGMTLETSVQARNYGDHSIVEPLQDKVTLFPKNVRSVQKLKINTKDSKVEEIIFSDAKKQLSWAEHNIDAMIKNETAKYGAGDIEGPVPIAVVSKIPAKKTKTKDKDSLDSEKLKRRDMIKTVWIGNSFFISNGYIRSMEFNYDLFLNILSWLWGEEENISIRPKQLRTSTLLLTPAQSNIIFYVTVLAIPELILLFGLIIWIIRRKK